jgi:transcriptional regulator with XRE-family HTH domain
MHLELRKIRLEMGFSMRDMACELGLATPTYQGYEEGRRKVPQEVIDRAMHSLQKVREFMATAPARIDERINREFPFGFLSEVSE